MSESTTKATSTKQSTKSGRTPEQQAARDARIAAKAAKAVASDLPAAESSTSANAPLPSPRKRRRSSASASDKADDSNLLEIDTEAPTPLSKAEIRANRKKMKKGEDVEPKVEKKEPAEPKRKNSIWIGNLSFRTTQENLKDFLQRGVAELGGDADCVTRVNLPTKPGKGSYAENKGFAYVDFATPELQALALKLSEKPCEGRRVLIKLGDDHNATPAARTPKPPTIIAGTLPKKHKHGESSTLFVGNLPFDATEQGLRDLVETNAIGTAEVVVEEETEADEADKADKPPSRGGKKSGLKKVRLGAFEDTGRCKGFAFLDFHTPLLAKVALANRRNHFYNGRKLNVEFASEEATKRAGGRSAPKPGVAGKSDKPRVHAATSDDEGRAEEAVAGEETPDSNVRPVKSNKNDTRGKKWEAMGRPRPGAALAMAKREKVGIVEGEGQKIVFD